MSNFDPDAYLEEKDQEGFDPDAYLNETKGGVSAPVHDNYNPLSKGISKFESGLGGTMRGASYDFADTLAGGLEAAGSLAGYRGLGGSFSDIRREKPEEKGQSLEEVFKQGKDRKNEVYDKLAEANPGTFLIGDMIGSTAAPGGAARHTGRVGRIGITGAMGAVRGAGSSREEDPLEIAKDAAAEGAASTIFGAGTELIGMGLRHFPQAFTGIRPETADYYVRNVDDIKTARPIQDVADEFIDKTKEYGRRLKNDSSESFRILKNSGIVVPRLMLASVVSKTIRKAQAGMPVTPEAKAILSELIDLQHAINGKKKGAVVSIDKVKSLVKQLDDKIDWQAVNMGKATAKDRYYMELAREYDDLLKTSVPAYATHMKKLAAETAALARVTQSAKSPSSYDARFTRIGRQKNAREDRALRNLDKNMDTNFAKELRDSVTKDLMDSPTTHGSRNAVVFGSMGSAAGTAVGSLFDNPVIGGTIGAAGGTMTGYQMDQYARRIYRNILDKVSKYPKSYNAYIKVFQEMGRLKGPVGVVMVDNLLRERDPRYAEMMGYNSREKIAEQAYKQSDSWRDEYGITGDIERQPPVKEEGFFDILKMIKDPLIEKAKNAGAPGWAATTAEVMLPDSVLPSVGGAGAATSRMIRKNPGHLRSVKGNELGLEKYKNRYPRASRKLSNEDIDQLDDLYYRLNRMSRDDPDWHDTEEHIRIILGWEPLNRK